MGKLFATCLLLSAHMYAVPPAVLQGIQHVEGGQAGQEAGPNVNGTYDLGPMQINTSWLPELASHWGVTEATARQWVRDDPCTNVGVAAWILRTALDETNDLPTAIAYYHSHTPAYGEPYKQKVLHYIGRGTIRTAQE
jgi:soluble lytic murein transglycosylase-like protein